MTDTGNMEWRPIKTAPRDGREVLIYNPKWDFAPVATWEIVEYINDTTANCVWRFKDDSLLIGEAEGSIGWKEDFESGLEPVLWMPHPLTTQGR